LIMGKLSVAIVGAGMGGLAAASALRSVGIDVAVYEQATTFGRVGAGIQQSPNALKVLRRLGIEPRLKGIAFQPKLRRYREAASGNTARRIFCYIALSCMVRCCPSCPPTSCTGRKSWSATRRICPGCR
jgi:glycine/D-amino acid oxidase-like deaminating enzyme